jgi:hypothetical protein
MIGSPAIWNSFGALEHSLRTGEAAITKIDPNGFFSYLSKHPKESQIFNEAMKAKSHADIAAVLPAYDFSIFRLIADIGGGHGHLLQAVLQTAPASTGVLFDQPQVIAEVANQASARLHLQAGDFFNDQLPICDAYLMMNIIHDWDDVTAAQILSAVRRVAPPGAKLLVIETIVPDTPEPHMAKELDVNMLAVTGGRERTRAEYEVLFSGSGFKLLRVVPTASPYSILEAVPQ